MKQPITLFIIEIILQALYDYFAECNNPDTQDEDLANRESARVFFEGDPDTSLYRFYLGLLGVSTKDGLPSPQEIVENLALIGVDIDELTAKRVVEKKYNRWQRKVEPQGF